MCFKNFAIFHYSLLYICHMHVYIYIYMYWNRKIKLLAISSFKKNDHRYFPVKHFLTKLEVTNSFFFRFQQTVSSGQFWIDLMIWLGETSIDYLWLSRYLNFTLLHVLNTLMFKLKVFSWCFFAFDNSLQYWLIIFKQSCFMEFFLWYQFV